MGRIMSAHFSFGLEADSELKRAYAAALLRIQGANRFYDAAVMVVGGGNENIGKALWIASNWPNDPEVIQETQKLLRSDELVDNVPSKAQAALLAWELANVTHAEIKERVGSLKLFCEIQGFIAKPGTNVNVNLPISNNVMVVKDHGDDDEWERQLAAQQDELTNASAPTTH
jgi:thioredoxin reductase